MPELPGELPLTTGKLAMKKRRCQITMPISSKSSLPNNIRGVQNAMAERLLSNDLEGYYMDLHVAHMQRPSSALPMERTSAKPCWDDLLFMPLFELPDSEQYGDDYGSCLPQDTMKGWNSATCECISQTSNSSASQEEGGAGQAYQSPLNNQSRRERAAAGQSVEQSMGSPLQANLERESSVKQSISMSFPSVFTLDNNHKEDSGMMHKYFLSTRKARDFSVRRMHRKVINRALKGSPEHASADLQEIKSVAQSEEALMMRPVLSSTTDSMSETSSLTLSGQSRQRANQVWLKSVPCESRYQREPNSVDQWGSCAKLFHSSGYHGKGETNGTIEVVQPCKSFCQSESNGQSKHRHSKEPFIAPAECRQLTVPKNEELAVCESRPRSLSQKYRPRGFEEIVGQHIVSQSLSNAIIKGKIAPVYLFQGPRGTGKTSVARIFVAALLCIAPQEQRPCGVCQECSLTWLGRNIHVKEVDAASHNGVAKVRVLLEEISYASASSLYKVFVIDECHVLTTETWNALLKILEEPPLNVVLILITTDSDQMPRTAVSRCQKFPFPKIKDADIIKRLKNIASHESLELDLEVLNLIASRADGSLRDAEMILDQLGLLGQDINSSTVNELVGSASEGQMLSLLSSALLADTMNTIKKARELVDAGVQPLSLMSQMATLIIDILAGSFQFTEEQTKGFFRRQTFSKLEQLRKAVKILSEGEKQLRQSHDRMTWLTATLLQLGPNQSCMLPVSGAHTSVAESPMTMIDSAVGVVDTKLISPARSFHMGDFESSWNSGISNLKAHLADQQDKLVCVAQPSVHSIVEEDPAKERNLETLDVGSSYLSPEQPRKGHELSARELANIWSIVVQNCRPFRLRQSLHGHGKLVSILIEDVCARVRLEFVHPEHKTRCERFWRNISDVFETVLGCCVAVEINFNPENGLEQAVHAFPEQKDPKTSITAKDLCEKRQSYDAVDHLLTEPQPPSGSIPKELVENRRTYATTTCSSTRERLIEAKVLASEEQLDKAWICNDADIIPSFSSAVHQNPKAALPVIPTARTSCDWTCEDASEFVEPNRMLHSFCMSQLRDECNEKIWNILDHKEGQCQSGCGDGQKENMSKVALQRLTLRSRNRSLLAGHHNLMNCDKDQSRDSRSSDIDTRYSCDITVLSGNQGGKALAAPQLRNKLKEAAGSIARFFQVKKTIEEPSRCIRPVYLNEAA